MQLRILLGAPLLFVLLGAPLPVAPPVVETSDPVETALPDILVATIDHEIDRIEAHIEALGLYENELAARRLSAREAMEASRTFAAESSAKLRPLSRGAEAVDPVYIAVVERLRQRQQALAESLKQWRFASGVPSFAAEVDPDDLDTPATAMRLATLRELRSAAAVTETRLREEERELRRERVDLCAASVSRLYEVRTTALGKLPAAHRRSVLGPTQEGLDTLKLESQRLALAAQAYFMQTLQWLTEAPALLDDVFQVGRVSWAVLKLFGVFLIYLLVRRRFKPIRDWVHKQISSSSATRSVRRRLHRWVDAIAVVLPWLVVIALLQAIRWALGTVALRPEVDLPLRLVSLYVYYRLINDVVLAISLTLARAYQVRVDRLRETRLQQTVRLITRVGVAIAALLVASQSLLGRGLLYHLVVNVSWLAAILTAWVLLRRWRPVIAEAYLKQAPGGGRLARMVEATKARWYGVFVAAAAFVWLAGRGIAIVVRDFAMQFDGTRRALAFIFRRKMEKHAEKSGYATVDETELPETVRAAFSPEDPFTPELMIDHFPGLDLLHERLERWRTGEARGSYLLSGRKGMGKTAWLTQIEAGETPITRIALDHRMQSEAGLAEKLARELGLDAECSSLRALGKALRDIEPRVVVCDRLQNLFLSRVGGYTLVEAFVSLIELTSDRIFWIGAMSGFAIEHLIAVHPELMIFRHHQALGPWSEEQIGDLIAHRSEIAGASWDYEALLSDRFERRYAADRAVETAEGYHRLLWDYSGGNPRIALHFWLRSLVPLSERRAKIKLFRPPDDNELEQLGNRALFLLAAIVTHENLSLREAAQVTRYPDATCRIQLERLRDGRMLRLNEGRYRLTTHWHQAIIGHLSRNNLLPD